jgi:hypothetical protein
MRSLDFSIDLILSAALWPWGDSTSNRNEYQERSWGVKDGWCIRLTTSLASMSQLSRKCGSLDVSQPCGPPWLVRGIALPSLPFTTLSSLFTIFVSLADIHQVKMFMEFQFLILNKSININEIRQFFNVQLAIFHKYKYFLQLKS